MRADETREKILAATDQLFGSLGFDATTTREIAERSGVNKALIHYHFRSKDALLAVLLEGHYDRLSAAMTAALQRQAKPERKLQDLADAYSDFLADNRAFCSIVQREVANGRHVERMVQRTLPMFQLGTRWLTSILPNPPSEIELAQMLTSVYGMVVAYFTYGRVLQQLTGVDPFSPQALEARKRHVRRVVTTLFRDLKNQTRKNRRSETCPRSTRRTPRKKNGS